MKLRFGKKKARDFIEHGKNIRFLEIILKSFIVSNFNIMLEIVNSMPDTKTL